MSSGSTSTAPSTPIYRRRPFFSIEVRNPREADTLTASGMTPLNFRPVRSQNIDLAIQGGQNSGLHIWTTRSRSGFITVPFVDAGVVSVRFVTQGSLTRRGEGGEFHAHLGVGLLQNFDPMREEQASADFRSIAATVDRAVLAAHYQALEARDGAVLPDFAPVAQTSLPSVRAFLFSLVAAHAAIRQEESIEGISDALLQEVLLYQFLGSWPRRSGPGAKTLSPHARAVHMAMEFIEAHIGERLRLSDVAAASGTSVRSLQNAFKAELGKPILQVILERRLDGAHADLRATDNTGLLVSQIAYRWGFTHLSDFSRRYRDRFGHVPSARQSTRGR